jgi:hypothetical protein
MDSRNDDSPTLVSEMTSIMGDGIPSPLMGPYMHAVPSEAQMTGPARIKSGPDRSN